MPYRRIDVRVWDDEKIADKDPLAKLVWLYVLTGRHTTSLPGLWIAGTESLAEGLRLDRDIVEAQLCLFERMQLIQRDAATRVLRVPKCPRYNQADNERVVHAWFGHWQALPDVQLKRDHLVSLWSLGIKWRSSTDKRGVPIREAWAETFGLYLTHRAGMVGECTQYTFMTPDLPQAEQLALRLSAIPSDHQALRPSGDVEGGVRESFANCSPGSGSVPGSGSGSGSGGNSRIGEAESRLQEGQALSEAYAQGIRDGSHGPFPCPAGDQVGHLITAASTFALTADGRTLQGSERLSWVRQCVAEYRTMTAGEGARFQRGYEPRSWLLWLQAGRPTYKSNGASGPPPQRGGYTEEDARAAEARFEQESLKRLAKEKARYAAAGVKDPWGD